MFSPGLVCVRYEEASSRSIAVKCGDLQIWIVFLKCLELVQCCVVCRRMIEAHSNSFTSQADLKEKLQPFIGKSIEFSNAAKNVFLSCVRNGTIFLSEMSPF